MVRILENKKGGVFAFIYATAFFGFLIILYIIFSQITYNHLLPVSNSTFELNETEQQKVDDWFTFWDMTPYVIIFVVLLFIFVWIGYEVG